MNTPCNEKAVSPTIGFNDNPKTILNNLNTCTIKYLTVNIAPITKNKFKYNKNL